MQKGDILMNEQCNDTIKDTSLEAVFALFDEPVCDTAAQCFYNSLEQVCKNNKYTVSCPDNFIYFFPTENNFFWLLKHHRNMQQSIHRFKMMINGTMSDDEIIIAQRRHILDDDFIAQVEKEFCTGFAALSKNKSAEEAQPTAFTGSGGSPSGLFLYYTVENATLPTTLFVYIPEQLLTAEAGYETKRQ
jgi:hypothetical protein